MRNLQKLHTCLKKATKANIENVYNYTIPQSWNTFGYSKTTLLRSGELVVNPYDYSCFAIEKILEMIECQEPSLKKKGKKGQWIQEEVLYFADIRTLGCWDHDRSDRIEQQDIYNLQEQGTFLKAILLLPLLKRAGITTLVIPNILSMSKTKEAHDFADFRAVNDISSLDESYLDPLLSNLSIEEQFHAFTEAIHGLGMHILFGINPALMARNNVYIKEHPEWFYWIDKQQEFNYMAPHLDGLPINCAPSDKVCQLLYKSESGSAHINAFVKYPTITSQTNLEEIEKQLQITTAPMISDQINTFQTPLKDLTMVRFFEDASKYSTSDIPCLMQDQVRMDLYPGKHKMQSLWDMLLRSYTTWITEFELDGFYLMNPYMIPTSFIKEMVTTLRKAEKHTAFLVESVDMYDTSKWEKLGIDAITGNSGYSIHDVMGHQYHNFTYSLRQFSMPVCAASEFMDTPRIAQYEGSEKLAQLLSIMNLFLPNAIPTFMAGQLAFEKQPQYLSAFADQAYLTTLDRKNPHYKRQAILDRFTYNYTRNDFHVFINELEIFSKIRKDYIQAILDFDACIPVWFDDPKDSGIGFTYILEDRAILVVCNTNLYEEVDLRIHTENMLWKLPFTWNTIHQIHSNLDPFTHVLQLDDFQALPLHFGSCEVKVIELI